MHNGPVKVGLLGGSFDPVHRAHIALAQTALKVLALDEVQLIPAADPWQRPKLVATPAQRLHMLERVVQGCDGLCINPMEIERGGASHTLTTLEALPATVQARPVHYYWLLGSDQLNNFCTWYRWQDIARRVRLVVAKRPDAPLHPPPALLEHLAQLQRPLLMLPFTPLPISATQIRQMLAQGQHHKLLLDDILDSRVLQYIQLQGLYRLPRSPAL